MKAFIGWLKRFGVKLVIDMMNSKVDWLAKKMADSVDIPFIDEKNEKKEAKKAIKALTSLLEELCEDILKEEDVKKTKK
tara:strand:+ start:70 stop:306 length:237 start_codon:yes stop_codon:yes gene_type:complete